MVFEMRRNIKKKENPKDLICKSADSGVSVAYNKIFKGQEIKSSNNELKDLEEEQLDFEPDFEDGFDKGLENTPQRQCEINQLQSDIYSDQSTVKDLSLDGPDVNAINNYTDSHVSIAHGRDMLPTPRSNAKDGRQNQYLPLYYTPSSRTTLDSSSDEISTDSDTESNVDIDTQESFTVSQNSYQFDDEIDENSSTSSITQEEEDKLLDSSADESQNDSLIMQTGTVETLHCQIGNARITLPKFINDSHNFQNSDLKRTKSRARLKAVEGQKKKKKKWDLAFKPKCPLTHLFLEDIGYISACENEVTNKGCTVNSNVPNLIVICNKNKITCEESEEDSQSSVASGSKSDEYAFKQPLPPLKRPPTRPKRTVSNSDGSVQSLQIKFSNKDDHPSEAYTPFALRKRNSTQSLRRDDNVLEKDDALSIIASTIEGDSNDNEDIKNFNFLEEKNHTEAQENCCYVEDRVKEWVQNVSSSKISSDTNSVTNTPNPIVTNILPQNSQGGLNYTAPPVSPRGNPRIHFRDIPNVFSGLCYYYYFNENCTNPHCYLSHVVNMERLVSRLKPRNPDEVNKAFKFTVRFERIFKESYPAFITVFGLLKMQNELIASIKLFLQMERINSTEAVEHIVTALEQSGLSFQEAVEMISFNIGFMEYPVIADILLDLITRNYNISENWEVIKKISRARGKVPPSIVKKILSRAVNTYPVNDELCLDIYNVFVKNNMTNLSQISEEILTPYRILAGFRDAIPVVKNTVAKSPKKIQPISVPNHQELLAAHIDNNLIRERERFERKIEGTPIIPTVTNRILNQELNYSMRNFNYGIQQTPSLENRSNNSDSDERITLSPRPMPFPKRDYPPLNVLGNDNYLNNTVFPVMSPCVSSSPVDVGRNNVTLNFQPPSDVSEYVPASFQRDDQSDDQQGCVTLTPPRPIFGTPCYRNGFSFKKSLHNLLPDNMEHVNINEKDVSKLNTVIKTKNGFEFYKLLQYYKKPPTIQNFITMTIVHLKSSDDDVYDNVIGLIKSVELVNPDYAKDRYIKAVVEVVVMNLLFELQKKGQWNSAKNLLETFCDWDSLVSSKIFSKIRITHMGRYIFLARIFAKAKSFHFTYEILLCPNLKLLGSPETWLYFYNTQIDLEGRNAVLTEFLKYAHHYYIIGVSDLYRRNYKYGGIHGFDAHVYFNPMLISMINEQQTSLLKYFYPDIDIYYKVMEKNVLRAFVILLANQFTQENLFRLYELCCERHIYILFTGAETNITVRNNMFDVELQLILSYYFFKMSENRQLPAGNVIIQIKLLDNKPVYPKMLQRCVRSIKEINEKIKKVLRDNFSISVSESSIEQLTVIEVLRDQVVKWLQCNQRWFPIL